MGTFARSALLMRFKLGLLLALALALGACATTSQLAPVPVEGQPDTMMFRVFLALQATDSAADQHAKVDFDAYKSANGYSSYVVVDRKFVNLPTHIAYTVKFTR